MEINGLPLHPLSVHAAVVFGPLAGLAALLYAVLPRWGDRLRWPMLVLALVAAVALLVAYFSGENFLEHKPELEGSPAVQNHEHRAGQLLWVTIAFSVVAIVTAWLHPRTGVLRIVLPVLLAIAAVALLVWVFLTGEAGARAVWG